jgi:hypothetical protein
VRLTKFARKWPESSPNIVASPCFADVRHCTKRRGRLWRIFRTSKLRIFYDSMKWNIGQRSGHEILLWTLEIHTENIRLQYHWQRFTWFGKYKYVFLSKIYTFLLFEKSGWWQKKNCGNMRNSRDVIPLFSAASSYSAGYGIIFAIQTNPKGKLWFSFVLYTLDEHMQH